jgi:hypothetical protein
MAKPETWLAVQAIAQALLEQQSLTGQAGTRVVLRQETQGGVR